MIKRYLLLVLLPLAAGIAWLFFGLPFPAEDAGAATDAAAVAATPLPRFLLQLLVVLAVAKLAGVLARQVGQPAVIGEMIAGIALGPSLFGSVWPAAQAWLFPAEGVEALAQVAQLGVLVFLFAAGAEFELSRLRGQRRQSVLIAHAGIALPFMLGLFLAWPLFAQHAPAGTGFVPFAVFMGIALSVTAFPVLLRILEDRGYLGTPVGNLAIACAAISDATAWALLAALVVWLKAGDPIDLALNLGGVGVLAWLLLGVLRPRLAARHVAQDSSWSIFGLVILALGCALVTEVLGLHLLFGAFLAGLAVSASSSLRDIVVQRIEPFAVVLLLPLFFASTGLSLRLDLLTGMEWLWCLGITGVATLGKLGGTVIAARACGIARLDAWRLGTLMNTRGLMELIVLALGLQLGLIGPRLYAMMILVAVATTVLTGPMLAWMDRRAGRPAGPPGVAESPHP